MSTELSTVKQVEDSLVQVGDSGLQLTSLKEMQQFAETVHKSEFCPKGFKTAGDVMIAIQLSAELGLTPMSGLQNIGVINGRPGIYGDAALALVRRSGLLEVYKEEKVKIDDKELIEKSEIDSDKFGIKVTVKRQDFDEASCTFTVADAKKAGLWKKVGPWTQYPKRMLMFRARGFVLRDQFGDVLKGMYTYEEARDISFSEKADRAKTVNTSGFKVAEQEEKPVRQAQGDSVAETPESKASS